MSLRALQDFTLDFYFRQHWHDPRLNFSSSGEDELCISNEMLGRIWWPDTFFANAKMASFHAATTHNAFLRISPNGNITQSLRCVRLFYTKYKVLVVVIEFLLQQQELCTLSNQYNSFTVLFSGPFCFCQTILPTYFCYCLEQSICQVPKLPWTYC